MAVGIIIHIAVGSEKRTEFFTEERIRIGSDDTTDLQIHTSQIKSGGVWFELENSDGVYRVVNFDPDIALTINGKPIRRFIAITDGDLIEIP
ncbi:MAG TPA: FHA domain-containing protein, partial [Pyrinomonadaceae bacterium]|nr:FHA domain-containing protein [Pyrinomonadaceae bacterium]